MVDLTDHEGPYFVEQLKNCSSMDLLQRVPEESPFQVYVLVSIPSVLIELCSSKTKKYFKYIRLLL
jgi:hypothetical protein